MKAIFKSDFGGYNPDSFLHGHRNGFVLILSLDPALASRASSEMIEDIEFTGFDDLPPTQPHFLTKRSLSQVEPAIVPPKPGPKVGNE